jgi:hypothetical protein
MVSGWPLHFLAYRPLTPGSGGRATIKWLEDPKSFAIHLRAGIGKLGKNKNPV